MKEGDLRFGIVGLGKMGILHSCILNVLPNSSVVALCEKSRMTSKLLGRMFRKARIVDDVRKLADMRLDAVYVTTPIPSHFAVMESVSANKVASNFFVEKTLAANYREAKRLCDLASSFGGVNMVGYLRRYCVTFRKAKELLSQQTIGKVVSFKAYGYSSDFAGLGGGTVTAGARGGVLRDLGCHVIDLALWFFGDLSICSAEVQGLVDAGSQDVAVFNVKSSEGLEGEFRVSWCMEDYRMPEIGLSIVGSDGTIEVNDDKVLLSANGDRHEWYRHDLNDNVGFWLALPEYYREDLHFAESIRARQKAEPDFQAASKVDRLIDEIEESVKGLEQR